VLERCRVLGVKTVAGGPLFTSSPEDFPDVDHLVLGEAEVTLPLFLADVRGGSPRRIYRSDERANLSRTPLPRWDLIDIRKYASMNIQYSRGCPYDCEFCDITQLFGREPRTKSREQLTAELDHLYALGWRGGVFFVDDNFIAEKRKLKGEILPAVIAWMRSRRGPFNFFTEASINLADDPELLEMMVKAGFEEVFIGIESPEEASLSETGKVQNRNRDMLASVRRIQQAGLQVQGGFIVGFDSDLPSVFEKQLRFVQESGIVTAMVGMLTALRGTKLHRRLSAEGRIVADATGDNTADFLNFIPRMEAQTLVRGYRNLLATIYAPTEYYRRVMTFLREYRPPPRPVFRINPGHIRALFRSVLFLGLLGRERFLFWKVFFWSLVRKPRAFPVAITLAIYGYHFRKVAEKLACGESLQKG
jgi:radical SAM superfamily enzyme YgiQ (UPF0313 family)